MSGPQLPPQLLHLPSLAFRRSSAAALAHDHARDVDFLLRRLVDVHRARDRFRHVRLGKRDDDHAAIMIIEQKFDDVAFANRRGRLHALSVDLDVTAATSVGGIATLLEKADQFEPVIDSMSFHL